MPIVTAQTLVYNLLANLPLNGTGGSTLNTVVRPPDPETVMVQPMAFIWPADGPEHRESIPRPQQGTPGTGGTQAGWKQLLHDIDVWVMWEQDPGDPQPDINFPGIVDDIMDALRCATDPVKIQDPRTYRWSQVSALGEKMRYDIVPPRALAGQRIVRYDARVSVSMVESFQA